MLKPGSTKIFVSEKTLKLIEKVGIKKAYQVVKTKYKISRNKFYEMAIKLNNE